MSKFIFNRVDYSIPFRRGMEEVEIDGDTYLWPRCEISNCEAFICVGMSKSLCYPHGIELKAFTKEEFELDRKLKLK